MGQRDHYFWMCATCGKKRTSYSNTDPEEKVA
ncbi:hypothetical protein vBRpoSV10_109 [Ruegeria phage vB_RpoS-V10]|nr:hypothetical protein vBRpoSV10_109 [Ruegeria phage vB_RpoS-V10]